MAGKDRAGVVSEYHLLYPLAKCYESRSRRWIWLWLWAKHSDLQLQAECKCKADPQRAIRQKDAAASRVVPHCSEHNLFISFLTKGVYQGAYIFVILQDLRVQQAINLIPLQRLVIQLSHTVCQQVVVPDESK